MQSDSTHQRVICDILRSLSQLNYKVDNLITRLDVLEMRLPETPKTERNLASVGKVSHRFEICMNLEEHFFNVIRQFIEIASLNWSLKIVLGAHMFT